MKIFACVLCLLISLRCPAQLFSFNQGGTVQKDFYVEIPYESENGKIFIRAEIAGKQHRFLFDTGAPVSISKALAAELNSKTLTKILLGDAFSHHDSTAIVEVNDLKLGELLFDHVPAICGQPDFFDCYHIDGAIGSNLLRNCIVSIAPDRQVIIVTDQKEKLNLKSKNSKPLITTIGLQSSPFISILLKGKRDVEVSIEFDTGDKEFFRLEDRLMNMLAKYAVFDTLASGFGADKMSVFGLQDKGKKYLLKVAPITICNGTFTNLVIESNPNAQPSIGSGLLNYGTVTLDFIHHKFYFDARQPLNDLAEKHWPFGTVFINNKLLIGVVYPKAAGQLVSGDQIIAVDDRDLSHLQLCDLINSRPIADGKETVVLTLKDAQGGIKKVMVKKEYIDN